MHTSREVYDRIRWDPRIDPTRFVIGYESRLPEPREVAFTAFVPDGDIPWHRVLYFREGSRVVWDRRTRLDTVHPDAPGLTFDPASNALAARMSINQRRARIDRVFLRDGAWSLQPTAAELFATEPIEHTAPPLFPSDHFGLAVCARIVAPAPEDPLDPRDAPLAHRLRDPDPERSAAALAARRAAVAHLAEACVAALPGDQGRTALHLTGAVRLGVAEEGSDVDAIAVGPAEVPREAFFEVACEWIHAVGGEAWIARDAVLPVLRGVVSGVAVDLGYAALPPDLAARRPEAMSQADLARLDPHDVSSAAARFEQAFAAWEERPKGASLDIAVRGRRAP
jgi:uncharacterized protein (UPF0248 family)